MVIHILFSNSCSNRPFNYNKLIKSYRQYKSIFPILYTNNYSLKVFKNQTSHNNIKLPIDIVKNEFINRGHVPLFDTYNHIKEKLDYYCRCGNSDICSITLDNLKKGADNCSTCSKQKRKKTNNQKYGTDYPIQSEQVKDKIKERNLEKYGVEYPAQSKIIYQKVRQTNLQKYGVEFSGQSNEIKTKKKKHNLQKYGVAYPMQNQTVYQA